MFLGVSGRSLGIRFRALLELPCSTRETWGNDMCMASGMTVRCRSDRKRRQCTGKRLIGVRAVWSSFNKEGMSHLCDSTVASPAARRDNVLASIGHTPRGSCNRTLLRRVLRRFSTSRCFLEGFLEGAW